MSPIEIAIWSACFGIYISYTLLSLFYLAYNRSVTSFQTVLFVVVCGCFVLVASGLGKVFFNYSDRTDQQLTLLLSALATAYSAMGLRNFLRAEQRDAVVDKGLLMVALVGASLALAVFWPDEIVAKEIAAVGCVACATVAFWLAFRAWLLGDRFALPMAVACFALIFGVLGLHALNLGILKDSLVLQVFYASMAAVYMVIVCHTTKRRHSEYRRMNKALSMSREKDLLTQLWTGAELIRKIDDAIARSRRNRKEMAMLCVEIYNAIALRQEHGNHGLEQVIYTMAARIRKSSGSVALVGRYTDNSFVVVLDSVKQVSSLKTLGLRLAAAVRRPFILDAFTSEPREFRADVGVGVARVASGREASKQALNTSHAGAFDSFSMAQVVLHEASELALAARSMGTRAAILDAYSRRPIELESVEVA